MRSLATVLNVLKLPNIKDNNIEDNVFMQMLEFCDIWVKLADAKGIVSGKS